MTPPLEAIDKFITYTKVHGPQHDITLHDLFFLQDFLYQDLEYCKNQKARALKIIGHMNKSSPDVKIIVDSVNVL